VGSFTYSERERWPGAVKLQIEKDNIIKSSQKSPYNPSWLYLSSPEAMLSLYEKEQCKHFDKNLLLCYRLEANHI